MNNIKYNELINKPLSECKRSIKELRSGLYSDYCGMIVDYSTELISMKKRLIAAKNKSETHEINYLNGMSKLIKDLNCKIILDLGCGNGTLLNYLTENCNIIPYGLTINLDEIKYAKDNYNLNNIAPIDMREISYYYDKEFFDCILVYCSFTYIYEEERIQILKDGYNLLKSNGYFICVDYKYTNESKTPINWDYSKLYIIYKCSLDIRTLGELTIFKKI